MTGIGNCCCEPPHAICWTVDGCTPDGLADAHVVIRGPSPSTTIVCEGDTDASGRYCCNLNDGTYTLDVTHPSGRFQSHSRTFTAPGGGVVKLDPDADYVCCVDEYNYPLCKLPIKRTLSISGTNIAADLEYDATGNFWEGWGDVEVTTGASMSSYGFNVCDFDWSACEDCATFAGAFTPWTWPKATLSTTTITAAFRLSCGRGGFTLTAYIPRTYCTDFIGQIAGELGQPNCTLPNQYQYIHYGDWTRLIPALGYVSFVVAQDFADGWNPDGSFGYTVVQFGAVAFSSGCAPPTPSLTSSAGFTFDGGIVLGDAIAPPPMSQSPCQADQIAWNMLETGAVTLVEV
jgi:hypothetical protein